MLKVVPGQVKRNETRSSQLSLYFFPSAEQFTFTAEKNLGSVSLSKPPHYHQLRITLASKFPHLRCCWRGLLMRFWFIKMSNIYKNNDLLELTNITLWCTGRFNRIYVELWIYSSSRSWKKVIISEGLWAFETRRRYKGRLYKCTYPVDPRRDPQSLYNCGRKPSYFSPSSNFSSGFYYCYRYCYCPPCAPHLALPKVLKRHIESHFIALSRHKSCKGNRTHVTSGWNAFRPLQLPSFPLRLPHENL